jgi:hypothetical protein
MKWSLLMMRTTSCNKDDSHDEGGAEEEESKLAVLCACAQMHYATKQMKVLMKVKSEL